MKYSIEVKTPKGGKRRFRYIKETTRAGEIIGRYEKENPLPRDNCGKLNLHFLETDMHVPYKSFKVSAKWALYLARGSPFSYMFASVTFALPYRYLTGKVLELSRSHRTSTTSALS